jgi:putative aminopeptidase FrvX
VALPELLDALLRTPGPSGNEAGVARVWRDWCAGIGAEVGVDSVGSSWARVSGRPGGLTLAAVGHIDEIGVHVTHIDDNGFLRFRDVGGWDAIVLVGQRIVLSTKDGPVHGVIARKPIHLLDVDERKKFPALKELHIDIGATDGEQARSMVRIGDTGVIDVQPLEMANGRVVSRALDNRVGCFVVARAAQLLAESGDGACDFLAIAAAQEETTLVGSATSAFRHDPDVAIVVDVTFATDQPGVEVGAFTDHKFGSGPAISRGSTLHPVVSELLYETAEFEGIPYTLDSQGRWTSTDADAVAIARSGIPTGLVGVPLRYMHSPVEMVSLDDVEAAAQLIAAFARRLEPGTSFQR